jgi:tetrahydroxynaphthalene reductase
MALELGRRGAKVIVNYANSDSAAEEVVNLIKKNGSDAARIKADVTNVDDIVRLFAEAHKTFGKLNIVCSNSGVVSFGHVKDVTPEEFDRVFNVNTRGQFFVAREAYKYLEVGGRLILMGSITGQAKAVPKHAVYSASKGAIETFVRCMAIGMWIGKLPSSSRLTAPRLRRQEDHGECRRPRRHQDGHVPRRLQRVHPQRRQAR